MEIPRKEVLRYLGVPRGEETQRVLALVEDCIEELEEQCACKSVFAIYPVSFADVDEIQFAEIKVHSKNLYHNVNGCEKIILFAATLGSAADRLLKKYEKLQMSKAVTIQAAAAAMIEEYCDTRQETIREELEQEGYYLRPRFSPGYGDFSIVHQADFIQILETPKKIGLSMTDSMILTPTKSVTAVIGLSRQNSECHKKGCEECAMRSCAFRRS